MIFDAKIEWTGINFRRAEEVLVNEVANVKVFNRRIPDKIIKYSSLLFDMLIVESREQPSNVEWLPVTKDHLVDFTETKAWDYIGEYPVIILWNGHAVLNIVIKDVSLLKKNIVETVKFFTDVIGAKDMNYITEATPFETVQDLISRGKASVNRFYIPTHDLNPALWLAEGNAERVFDAERRDFTTDEIKKWFSREVKSGEDKVFLSSIRYKDVECTFWFNPSYQRFNGSLSYGVLLYPVFVKFWEEMYSKGYITEADVYSNWAMWTKTGGDVSTKFLESVEPATSCEEDFVGSYEDMSVGEWTFQKKDKWDMPMVPAKRCGIEYSEVSAQLMVRVVTVPNYTPKVTVFSKKHNSTTTFLFEKKEQCSSLLGRTAEVAQKLCELLTENGFNEEDYIVK